MTTTRRPKPRPATDPRIAAARLERAFATSVRASDIAEPLLSFDADAPAQAVRSVLDASGSRVAGVRDDGLVVATVTLDALPARGACGAAAEPIDYDRLVTADTPFQAVLSGLRDRPFVLVRSCGAVAGVVTDVDVEKPPARMWLFGLVTALELALTGVMALAFPGDEWQAALSPGRLRAAQDIVDARRRLHHADVTLFDCLQFGDKAEVLLSSTATRKLLGMPSRAAGQRAFRAVQGLRNTLAHAQALEADDWKTIVALADRVEQIVGFSSLFGAHARR